MDINDFDSILSRKYMVREKKFRYKVRKKN
jgi:hypothetical protein